MGFFDFLQGNTAAGVVKEGLGAVGSGIGNLLDRFWPKKMSEAERTQAVKDMMQYDLEQGKTEVADVNAAREMWMTFLKTQKLPWLPRFMNGMLTPTAGFTALAYLSDKLWVQWLNNILIMFGKTQFNWVYITRDPVTDSAMTIIILFFFGYRYKKKQAGITDVG